MGARVASLQGDNPIKFSSDAYRSVDGETPGRSSKDWAASDPTRSEESRDVNRPVYP
ncbi:hypothetical protein NOGI109294_13350 [Nocardiopsis gilva]